MTLELNLTLANSEGALLRLLGSIERRGFGLSTVHSASQGESLKVRLGLDPRGRSLDVLLRQVRKLVDVLEAGFELAPRPLLIAIDTTPPRPPVSRSALAFLGIPEPVAAGAMPS